MTEPAEPSPLAPSVGSPRRPRDRTAAGFEEHAPATPRVGVSRLGGRDAGHSDRELAAGIEAVVPGFSGVARTNRKWIRGIVAELADTGVTQFLDLGTGLPNPPHLRHVLGPHQSRSRVIYVDHDAMVVRHVHSHYRAPGVAAIHADLTDPYMVLRLAQRHGHLDLDRPVAVLAAAVLHYLDDRRTDIAALTHAYTEVLAPGSYLAISHYHRPDPDHGRLAAIAEAVLLSTLGRGWFRTHDQIHSYFAGLRILDPGLRAPPADATIGSRRPVDDLFLAGLARKS
ncbi:SAM-dependent methyltransferase [Nocardia takedensis]